MNIKNRVFICFKCRIETSEIFAGLCRECKADENQSKRDLVKHTFYEITDPKWKLIYLYENKGNECRRCGFNDSSEALVFSRKASYRTLGIKDKLNKTMKSLFDMLEDCHLYCKNCHVILSKNIEVAKKEVAKDKYDRCRHCQEILKLDEIKWKSCVGCFARKNTYRVHYELIWGFDKMCNSKKCKAGKYTHELVIYNKSKKEVYDVLSIDTFNYSKVIKELKLQGYDTYCYSCMYEHKYDGGSEQVPDII